MPETKNIETFTEVSLLNAKKCDYCELPIKRKGIRHINICQEIPIHRFCSEKCKLDFIESKK